MAKREKISASELTMQLQHDPAHVARQLAFAERQRESIRKAREDQHDLLADLQRVGIEVSTVWDLVNTRERYDAALPTLADHLTRDYPDACLDGIARALALPQAKFAWKIAVQAYLLRINAAKGRASSKDGLAVLLAAIADDSVLPELVDLVSNTENGESRVLLLSALKRSKRPEAISAVLRMRSDPQLAKEIDSWKTWLARHASR